MFLCCGGARRGQHPLQDLLRNRGVRVGGLVYSRSPMGLETPVLVWHCEVSESPHTLDLRKAFGLRVANGCRDSGFRDSGFRI